MDEIISYKMCAIKVRNAKLRNYLKSDFNFYMRVRTYEKRVTGMQPESVLATQTTVLICDLIY